MINSFKKTYQNVNHINTLSNFYELKISDLNKSSKLKSKYDLIIFDTYKNISKIPLDNLPQNINNRYITSLINSKYNLFQVLFSINKLNPNGDLIILLSGHDDIVYQQILVILLKLFDSVSYFSSEFDYSYRYFVIAKGYKPDPIIENKLSEIINTYSDDTLLLNIFSEDSKILNFNMSKHLNDKFNLINQQMMNINKFFKNEQFIKKIYYDTYFYQITNTNNLLQNIFGENRVNPEYFNMIYEYKLYLTNILSKNDLYLYTFVNTSMIKKSTRFEYLMENVLMDDLVLIFKPLSYLKIFDIIFNSGYNIDESKQILKNILKLSYPELKIEHEPLKQIIYKISNMIEIQTQAKSNKSNNILSSDRDINIIIEKSSLNDISYIDWEYFSNTELTKTNLFDNMNHIIIFKFNINSIRPLLINILYVYFVLYKKVLFIRSNVYTEYMYMIGIELTNTNNTQSELAKLYSINMSKINLDYFLVSIDNEWINQFNEQISKFIIVNLVKFIRLRYPYVYNDFISFFNNIIRKKL